MAKKVLIIDDDVELSAELAEILSDEGHAVEVHLFKREDLPRFDPDPYDVIILDFKMPELSGTDILRAISAKNSKAKVIVISGKPFVENLLKKEKLLIQVAHVFSKPFSIQALLDKVKAG